MIFAMSDVFWQASIAGAVTLILAWMQRQTQKSLKKNTEVTETVHKLVNSSFLHQLRLHANTARILSDVTNEPGHREIADEAERVLKEHLRMAQQIVDGPVKNE